MSSAPRLVDEKAYRYDTTFTNYSALRIFNVCPNLYREQYITKEYKEPDKDYFLYGSLVDCMLTCPEELEKKYVRVDSKVDASDALKYEQKIKELELEMETPDKKGLTMKQKAESDNKTAQSGIASRIAKIEELREKLHAIKQLGTKRQVTGGMWQDAQETAEAIRNNPTFKMMTFNEFTSQQIFVDQEANRKGILDHVTFAPGIQKLYAALKAGMMEDAEFRAAIAEIEPEHHGGIITDIKTTYLLSEFEPMQYAGQLAVYQQLVYAATGIMCRCRIIAGDKDPNIKRAQDYELSQPLLDAAYARFLEVERYFTSCKRDSWFPSAKELWGPKQKCFRCSVCKDRPFSFTGPLMVNGNILK